MFQLQIKNTVACQRYFLFLHLIDAAFLAFWVSYY